MCCIMWSFTFSYAQVSVKSAKITTAKPLMALSTNNSGAWVARHGMSGSKYQQEFNKWTGKGYRLVLVDGYEVNGKAYYAAIWEKNLVAPGKLIMA